MDYQPHEMNRHKCVSVMCGWISIFCFYVCCKHINLKMPIHFSVFMTFDPFCCFFSPFLRFSREESCHTEFVSISPSLCYLFAAPWAHPFVTSSILAISCLSLRFRSCFLLIYFSFLFCAFENRLVFMSIINVASSAVDWAMRNTTQ